MKQQVEIILAFEEAETNKTGFCSKLLAFSANDFSSFQNFIAIFVFFPLTFHPCVSCMICDVVVIVNIFGNFN